MDIDGYKSSANDELQRFEVGNSREIVRLLERLSEKRTLVTIQAPHGKEAFLTTVLGLDEKAGKLYLECGKDSPLEGDLLAGDGVLFIAYQDGVRIQFALSRSERVRYDGVDAYKFDVPAKLYRIQRREFYRVSTSQVEPIKCLIAVGNARIEATVTDISVGGVGMRYDPNQASFEKGDRLQDCRLHIPGEGEFPVRIEVRSSADQTLKNGVLVRRSGCAFIDLPMAIERAIQTYIFKVERERRAMDL